MPDSARILGPDGPFDRSYKWFKVRECQQEMADEIESAIESKSHLIAESGTGTGKTFGYLVPPLVAGKKTVISTRTKNLQEQLYQSDIPWVCEALNIQPDVRVLKGRSNYFCLYRHDMANRQGDLLGKVERINRVHDWVVTERPDGDVSEYPGLPNEFRAMITSTADNCIGNVCEYSKECYVNRARSAARSADVLVVNHNLLCLNFLRGGSDESGLLSSKDVIIVDEAHRFPEIAAQSLGTSVSTERLHQLISNLETAAKEDSAVEVWIEQTAKNIIQLAENANTALSDSTGNLSLNEVENNQEFMNCYKSICHELSHLAQNLDPLVAPSFEKCKNQAEEILVDAIDLFARQSEENASWCEKNKSGFNISRIPLEPGREFGARLVDFDGSWVFTSATLAVGSDFSHFMSRLGIDGAISVQWESPFQFDKQALAYFPSDMPQPNNDRYDFAVAELIKKIMPITKGRTFVLFTSYRAMQSTHEMLDGDLDYTLLCQGKRSNTNLLEHFREDGNAVLLGTSSFWEGVDVKGEALSCVIIVKLPFSPPNDPIMTARGSYMESIGGNLFNDWQVPAAVLTMKQGAGRLIRDDHDKGMLVMCDPRVNTKAYGTKFLESLPPMPRTDKIEEVRRFFSG